MGHTRFFGALGRPHGSSMCIRGPTTDVRLWPVWRPSDYLRKCRLLGVNRKCAVDRQIGANDPFVWSGRAKQEDFDELAVSGLASMYPTFDWSVVLRAIMDINAPAFSLADRPRLGQVGHQYSHAQRRPNLHLLSSLAGERATRECCAACSLLAPKARSRARTLQAMRKLVGERDCQHVAVQPLLAASIQRLSP